VVQHNGSASTPIRASRWEVIGAWLHIWTPPRGVEIPPIPWRAVWLWGLAAVVLIAGTAAVAIPKIDGAKRAGAAQRAREQLAADNAERARLRRDQTPHRQHIAARGNAVAALERAITADARARVRVQQLQGPVLSTHCEPAATGVAQVTASRVYKCFVKTATGLRGEGQDILSTGYPFVATIFSKRREVVWCKQNPHADEKGSHGDVRVKLSPLCAGRLRAVL
jgi:type II secretory pathway pseudopilin PulG